MKELGLNERQIEALRLMVNESKIFVIEKYYKLFQINERTARRDLKILIEKGFIENKVLLKRPLLKQND